MKYQCKQCGCEEFISQCMQYDVFISLNGELVHKQSVFNDEELELFCRECSEKLEFDSKDVAF
jgi:hypothetical protein